MNTKKLIESKREIPKEYALCVKSECERCGQCHRHLIFKSDAKMRIFRVLNPNKPGLLGSDDCEFFADATHPAIYALGFMKFVSRLNLDEKHRFQTRCLQQFSKTNYYDMRGGKYVIGPAEQHIIREAAAIEGLEFPEDGFDYMFEGPNW